VAVYCHLAIDLAGPPTRERLSESRAETTLTWGPHSDNPWEPLFVNVNDAWSLHVNAS
jgi:hypothetical protein